MILEESETPSLNEDTELLIMNTGRNFSIDSMDSLNSPMSSSTSEDRAPFRFVYQVLYGSNPSKMENWSPHWKIEVAPLYIVYVPEIFAQIKEFVVLNEAHKNLRRQAQAVASELRSLYSEDWADQDLKTR